MQAALPDFSSMHWDYNISIHLVGWNYYYTVLLSIIIILVATVPQRCYIVAVRVAPLCIGGESSGECHPHHRSMMVDVDSLHIWVANKVGSMSHTKVVV